MKGLITIVSCLILVFICAYDVNGQIGEEHGHEHPKNLLGYSFGYTFVPKAVESLEEGDEEHSENGVFVPSFGVDYFHKISEQFCVGMMLDYELGRYLIIDKTLPRENAFLAVLGSAYEFKEWFALFGGAGIEFEKNKHLGVFRLGFEFPLNITESIMVEPEFMTDFKESYVSYTGAVVFVLKF